MRKSDCNFINTYNNFNTDPCGSGFQNDQNQFTLNANRGRNGLAFGIVMLDFSDFFDLMKLKIQYQRQSIS
jgi:hypothetical protein